MSANPGSATIITHTASAPAPTRNEKNQIGFFERIFGWHIKKKNRQLQLEKQELLMINQRHIESIKSLSDQLAKSLESQQSRIDDVTAQLKIVENLPKKQDELQSKMKENFERVLFYVQSSTTELTVAKKQLVALQNENVTRMGAQEIAEFMLDFLNFTLLQKQVRAILGKVKEHATPQELEILFHKFANNLKIVDINIHELNTKLEKYGLRLTRSLWTPIHSEDDFEIESSEECDSTFFCQLLKLSRSFSLFDFESNPKGIVISESLCKVESFQKEQEIWTEKRKAKIHMLYLRKLS